ncbi:hypothetical protein ACWEPC_23415 [Nonomuraea sp. NPDC004297]
MGRLVADPEEAAAFRRRLTPWVAGGMGQVIRIQPEIVTGFALVPAEPVEVAARTEIEPPG